MEISVMGAGYVGLTTAACLAELGHEVFCTDSDQAKLEVLRNGGMPFFEPHLGRILESNRAAGRLKYVSTDEAVQRGTALFICVGTPPMPNGEADLSGIEAVARSIAREVHGYRLVIDKSTVPVRTARRLEQHLAIYKSPALDYDVVSNPEFLREGSAIEDFFHPDRIVVGVNSRRATNLMEEIYSPLMKQEIQCPVHSGCRGRAGIHFLVTDTNSAELVKHASNSFLAMKISFINMVADLCEQAGADIGMVARGIGLDRRIGPAFLSPGIGFGGFCFPKDVQAFVRIAENFGCDFSLLKEVERINQNRIDKFIEKIQNELWVLRNKTIAVWGLAFKPNTDDIRFAPAIAIVRRLLAAGAEVQAFDPQAMERAKNEIPELTCCGDLYEAANGADAIIVLTEWQEFASADWERIRSVVRRPAVFDGRNCLPAGQIRSHGFDYFGVGEASASPAQFQHAVTAAAD